MNMHDETCIWCGEDMTGREFYDDICDACAKEDGLDGPWNEEDDNER